jgi:hypothetical protein
MLTQYVRSSRQLNYETICLVQQTVKISYNIRGTAESLKLTQYVRYSRQLN